MNKEEQDAIEGRERMTWQKYEDIYDELYKTGQALRRAGLHMTKKLMEEELTHNKLSNWLGGIAEACSRMIETGTRIERDAVEKKILRMLEKES
jgi:hypothetical protein